MWVKPLQCVLPNPCSAPAKPLQRVLPNPCSVSRQTLECGQTQLALMVLSASHPDVQIGRVHCRSDVSWEGGNTCMQPIWCLHLNQQAQRSLLLCINRACQVLLQNQQGSDRQTDGWTDRQTDRQTDSQSHGLMDGRTQRCIRRTAYQSNRLPDRLEDAPQ